MNLRTALGLVAFISSGILAGHAAESARDVLVFKDGDRLQGRIVHVTKETIVFRSDRFGEISVPADKAAVIQAERTIEPNTVVAARDAAPAPAAADGQNAAEHAESESVFRWESISPAVLTAKLREFFGPWHGRLAFSTEVVSDTTDRSNVSVEAQLKRKWKSDEVKLTGRYDYSETNARTTTDMVKADGTWRHDFSQNKFLQYRPALEWNRASFRAGLPSDYVLLQQEIGVGVNLLTKPARKLRVGVSENMFDVWTIAPPASHNSRTVESIFVESEFRLPGGLLLTDRGVYYYSLSSQDDGWENRAEVTKKFTETLSTAIRHEVRQGSPDGRAQDYTRLKLLVGLDF